MNASNEKLMNALADTLHAQGVFTVEVIRDGKNGPEVIQRVVAKNTVVSQGKKQLWRMCSGMSTKQFKFMRAGSSSLAVASAHTDVQTIITGSHKTCTTITMTGARTFRLVLSYVSGGGTLSAAFKEIAIVNTITNTGFSSLCRALLSPVVNKTTADKLKVTYDVKIT